MENICIGNITSWILLLNILPMVDLHNKCGRSNHYCLLTYFVQHILHLTVPVFVTTLRLFRTKRTTCAKQEFTYEKRQFNTLTLITGKKRFVKTDRTVLAKSYFP